MSRNSMGLKTKDKILDSAQYVFNKKGFENTSVEEIAEAAGITKAMIYYHFNSKENIMLKLIERLLNFIKEELNRQVSTINITNLQLMQNHINNMIDLWGNNKEIAVFIITKALNDTILFAKLQDIVKPFYDELIKNSDINKKADIDFKENYDKYFKLFFFNTLPMIFYPIFMDNFSMKYDMSGEKMNQIFTANFIQTLNNNIK